MTVRYWYWVPASLGLALDLISKHFIFAFLGGAPLLVPADVRDWRGLCARLRSEARSGQPTPASRIWQCLPGAAREAVRSAVQGDGSDDQWLPAVREGLNDVLRRPDFYDPGYFQGVAPPGVAARFPPDGERSPRRRETQRLNRRLLEAAFPELVVEAPVERVADRQARLFGPWLVLRLQENRGGVLGILQGKGFIFVILTVVALGFVAWMVRKAGPGQRRLHFALGLVTAGALGNLCDRLFLGYVRDFIYIEAINYPAFNLADACICVAAVLLFTEILRDGKRAQREGEMRNP